MSTSVGWYYLQKGAQQGPVSWEDLVMATRSGTIGPQDLVWNGAMSGWMAASTVPGLGPAAPPMAYYAPTAAQRYADDPAMRMILPIGRSGWAIAAGYLALFSVLVFPAPFALGTGIFALYDIRRHPEKLGKGRAIFGIVMGGLFSALFLWVLAVSSSQG
jgi:hypothetical protein